MDDPAIKTLAALVSGLLLAVVLISAGGGAGTPLAGVLFLVLVIAAGWLIGEWRIRRSRRG